MKKIIIAAVAIVGTLGISSYSIGSNTPKSLTTNDRYEAINSKVLEVDTIVGTRAGRANLAQAD